MKSNCLIFSVYLCRWMRKRGMQASLQIRWSHYGKFPHFLVAYPSRLYPQYHRTISFVPRNPKHKLLPPPLFDGYIKRGDQKT